MRRQAKVLSVKPLSKESIELKVEAFLKRVAPESLRTPQPTPVLKIIDGKLLDLYGFAFAVRDDLGPKCYGVTDFGEKLVSLSEDVYVALEKDEGRARFTGAHEGAHVLLHSDELCPISARFSSGEWIHLHRAVPAEIPVFRDPEWQANHGAGAILMPREMIRMVAANKSNPIVDVVKTFKVSLQAAEVRLKKLSLIAA